MIMDHNLSDNGYLRPVLRASEYVMDALLFVPFDRKLISGGGLYRQFRPCLPAPRL